jgi:hypothetical protein
MDSAQAKAVVQPVAGTTSPRRSYHRRTEEDAVHRYVNRSIVLEIVAQAADVVMFILLLRWLHDRD